MISITRRTLGVLVIKPAKGGAQFTVNAAGNPAQIKVRLDIARQGPPGPSTPGGSGDLSYTHTQSPAANVWTVNHNLNKRPAISVLTAGGLQVWGEVLHASANQAFVYFDSPFAGVAICS